MTILAFTLSLMFIHRDSLEKKAKNNEKLAASIINPEEKETKDEIKSENSKEKNEVALDTRNPEAQKPIEINTENADQKKNKKEDAQSAFTPSAEKIAELKKNHTRGGRGGGARRTMKSQNNLHNLKASKTRGRANAEEKKNKKLTKGNADDKEKRKAVLYLALLSLLLVVPLAAAGLAHVFPYDV